ncbi:MAG: Lrp/AsnC family transcriptional regulator [Nitrososphaerota archaeon]|jgi:DNA-binding Lrp family transcriptional regulator|nr:Lrp/AsnC family transcriptional regulator [Nitrososphaerota archaeon]MDG7044702.1 Lrp/AsnC family transcriptional regulator [Nitrososphaerota archaeon]MDG7048891.1 Lrp/AsnC family transcriptional regulator [Nitrososphaerota archaeon]
MTIKDLDVRVLEELIQNSNTPVRDIARKLGVSVGTVHAKIKAMERDGTIKGYAAVTDLSKVGYDITAVTEVIVSKGRLFEVEKEIAKMRNVVVVYDVTGMADIITIGKFRSREELSSFTKKVLSLPYVERTNTSMALTIVKEDFRLMPH